MHNEEHKSLQTREEQLLQLLQENDEEVGKMVVSQECSALSLNQVAIDYAEKILNVVRSYAPQLLNLIAEKSKGEKVYCVTKKTMEKIEKWGAHFIENSAKDGLAPVYRNADGKIIGHVDLEERFLPTGNPAMAFAMASLSSQLAEIQKLLQEMQESINDIYKGQWNDRFAKVEAAKNELFLAQFIENPERKQQIISNAIHLVCNGESEISRSIKDEIIVCENFNFIDRRTKVKKHLDMLVEHIPFLFEAWQIKLLLLQQSNEYSALAAEANRIRSEIQNLFTDNRLELLRSQTHNKIPFMQIYTKEGDYWTKDFKLKIDSSANKLLSLENQSKEIISYKKALLLKGA
jgi:hypothetical protein